MFGLVDAFKMGAAALAAAVIVYPIGHWRGDGHGRAAEQAAARERAIQLIEKRRQDDAEISRMDIAGLCAELGGRWVPDEDRCD